MVINSNIKAVSILFAATLLGGCSALNTGKHSDFACADDDCPTPIEVYTGTHGTGGSIEMGRTPSEWRTGGGGKTDAENKKDRDRKLLEGYALDLVSVTPQNMEQAVRDNRYVKPIRESSQVMRVWVAPWIDSEDNLHWSTYFFTEVTAKKWNFGEYEVRGYGAPVGLPLGAR
jgi:conjugal transfer pilus assembly protein TraV